MNDLSFKESPTGVREDSSTRKSSTKGATTKTTSSTQRSTQEDSSINLDYNIVGDMKKTLANISLYELCKLNNQHELVVKTFATSPAP